MHTRDGGINAADSTGGNYVTVVVSSRSVIATVVLQIDLLLSLHNLIARLSLRTTSQ